MASVNIDALSDSELLNLSRAGDSSAFGVLWERHRLAGIVAARSIAPTLDPDDLVSDSYLKILELVQAGRGPTGAFRPYLYRVISTTAVDTYRLPETATELLDQVPDLGEVAPWEDGAFDLNAAAQAFEALPERWQSVLWYSEVEGLPPRRIAPMLGISANSVSALAARAKEGLQSEWVAKHINMQVSDAACRGTRERLQRFQLGKLTARRTREVQAHLDTCADCRPAARELTTLNTQLALVLSTIFIGGVPAAALLNTLAATGAAVGATAAGAAGAAALSAGGAMAGSGAAGGAAAGGAAAGAAAGGAAAGAAAGATGGATALSTTALSLAASAALIAAAGGGVLLTGVFGAGPQESLPPATASDSTSAPPPSERQVENPKPPPAPLTAPTAAPEVIEEEYSEEYWVNLQEELFPGFPPEATFERLPNGGMTVGLVPQTAPYAIIAGYQCYIPHLDTDSYVLTGSGSLAGTISLTGSGPTGSFDAEFMTDSNGSWASDPIPGLAGFVNGDGGAMVMLSAPPDASMWESASATQCAGSDPVPGG